MNIPTVDVVNNWVYIDGIKAKKKYMPGWYHCRDIFYNNLFVVKIDKGTEGVKGNEQNNQEYRLWKRINKKDKIYFPESIYIDRKRNLLVQERMFPRSYKRTDETRALVDILVDKYNLSDVSGYDSKNWFMIGPGHPCIFDYGY